MLFIAIDGDLCAQYAYDKLEQGADARAAAGVYSCKDRGHEEKDNQIEGISRAVFLF